VECLCEDFHEPNPNFSPTPAFTALLNWWDVVHWYNVSAADFLKHWSPSARSLPVIGVGTWDTAFNPFADFIFMFSDAASVLRAALADAPLFVFRPTNLFTVHPPLTNNVGNSATSRVVHDVSIAAFRKAFGSRLLVWDTFALNEARPPRVSYNHTCYNSHVRSEFVDAEVQLLLWQLSHFQQ
jgi:hypothetical protein